jgi:hypothetical protein
MTPATTAMTVTITRPICSGKTAGRRGANVRRRKRLHIRDNLEMQDAFGIVIFAVVGLAVVGAIASLVGRGRLYEQIGRGGLSLNEDRDVRGGSRGGPPAGSAAATREREQEIRQMLDARNELRARRGEAAVDVDAELARLTAPAVDPALAAEIRSLVIARNERRARAGKPELDVDTEVARQIERLGGA